MRAATQRVRWPEPAIATVGLVVVGSFVAILLTAVRTTTYNVWAVLVIGPILVAVTVPILAREARRQGDRALFNLLVLALLVKLVGGLVRYYVDFHVYGGATDALGYHEAGTRWAAEILAGNPSAQGQSLIGTNFVELVTGVVYVVTRPTLLGGYLVFSWLGFLGLFFFYRAFVLAIPQGRSRLYAMFLFFLPSLMFWPSAIGKEAWMVFSLGMASLGGAHLLSGRSWRGLGLLTLGLLLAAPVRPHVAAILAASVAVAACATAVWRHAGGGSLTRRVTTLVGMAVITLALVGLTERFLQDAGVSTTGGVAAALNEVGARSAQGGSQFAPIVADSPLRFPAAAVTVLFRPFPFEADNAQALVNALEGAALLLLCVARAGWVLAAVRAMRTRPYVLFALTFVVLFIVAFSSTANFGILVRERVQVLPLFLVFLSSPPAHRRPATPAAARPARRAVHMEATRP